MTRNLDDQYFEWLISQIHIPNGRSYRDLFGRMHIWDFAWLVPGDNNRKEDAYDLRREFGVHRGDSNLAYKGISVLEVVVSLSRRLAFVAENTPEHWAWCLIKNLGLTRMSDPISQRQMDRVDDLMHNLVYRLYAPDGSGGFFPLKHPTEDQTRVELWYQMHAYINEMAI